MKIPFHKPHITSKEQESVSDVLRAGWLTMGAKTLDFENKFKNCISSKYAISVNSATSALHLALNAFSVRNGDEVIIPTNTFVSTAEAVIYSGAYPILCDIEEKNHNIDTDKIERLITSKTRAIIPVHIGGHPCKMDKILDIADRYNLRVIEDAAHALPAKYKRKNIGTFSDASCFSFYATKTLTTGEGGMVTTSNNTIADKIKLRRLHGIKGDAWKRYENGNEWYYEVVDLGFKYNMTDIQAAIGEIQLEKLYWMRAERKKVADKYIDAFKDRIEYINEKEFTESSWHLFIIKVSNRDELYKKLKENGISTSVHFIPIHKQPYYREKFGYKNIDYPIANEIYKKSLSLPIYPGLSDMEIEFIINNVLKFAKA